MTVNEKFFTVMESEGEDYFAFKINEGTYEDVIFRIGNVRLEETGDGSGAACNFDYNALYAPSSHAVELLDKSLEFGTIVGEVLNFMLTTSIKDAMNGIDGTNNTAELSQ
jgi:hypothetical protein